uniref:Ig-like domain-containing protein n=1 Tax=Gadus morhua TaxID=8049 RepID=A0A8C5A5V3_GADMO
FLYSSIFLVSTLLPDFLLATIPTFSPCNVCALRGAMVDIRCTYEYPDNVQYRPTTVRTLRFTEGDNYQAVDLKHDAGYTGRVEYRCAEVGCTGSRCHGTCALRIRDLRRSDSAVYKFRFTTNQPGVEHTGEPGVKLSVTVIRPPSGEIKEGGSVTLRCSTDANLAAKYTWFKDNQSLPWGPSQPYTFPSVRPEDRGRYSCHAENKYGQLSSNSIFVDVQYAPKNLSVTVSPSGELEEGSSVTLSCSSDANPAANYTWFKVFSVVGSGQTYTITHITLEHAGNYSCQAHNAIGLHNSTFLLIKGNCLFKRRTELPHSQRNTVKQRPSYVAVCNLCLKSFSYVPVTSSSSQTMAALTTIGVLLAIILLLVISLVLFLRRKRASRKACGQGGRPDTVLEVRHRKPFITNPSSTKTHGGSTPRPQHKARRDYASCLFFHKEQSEAPPSTWTFLNWR